MKVVALVLDKLTYGWSPEQLHFQHPALILGQIYSTLVYHWDLQEELDRELMHWLLICVKFKKLKLGRRLELS